MTMYWWILQILINETKEKKSKVWHYYIKYFFKYSFKNFSFDKMVSFDSFVFNLLYNPVGFRFLKVGDLFVLDFLLNRAFSHNFIYNLFLTPYKNITKKFKLDFSIKNLVRDFKILKTHPKFGVVKLSNRFFKATPLLKFLSLYLTLNKNYSAIYYYLAGSLFSAVKTYNWSPVNNYYVLFIIMTKYTENTNLRYADASKLTGYFYLNSRFEDYGYWPKKGVAIGDVMGGLYFKKLLKMKKAYINLYKNYFNFKLFSKAVQKSSVLKYNPETYVYIESSWKNVLKNMLTIRFSESSITKEISLSDIKNYSIFFIRKNKIFNKGRYSRNRQLYRTGVYWCLWLNVMIVYGLYFYFYRFTFNFGYIWWGLGFFIFSFIFGRAVQNNFHSIKTLSNEFKNTIQWLESLVYNFFKLFSKIWYFFSEVLKSYFYANLYVFKIINGYSWVKIFSSLNWFSLHFGPKHHQRFAYIWEYLAEKDTSFLRYKTILHWFKQVWKMLTTY